MRCDGLPITDRVEWHASRRSWELTQLCSLLRTLKVRSGESRWEDGRFIRGDGSSASRGSASTKRTERGAGGFCGQPREGRYRGFHSEQRPTCAIGVELARSQYALPRGGELLEACTAAQNHTHVGDGLSYGQERRSLGEPYLSGRL